MNKVACENVSAVAMRSVVSRYNCTIKHAISVYFKASFFILQVGVKTGLNIKCKNPIEACADKIANAIGAINAVTDKNIIVIDMGTATTLCAITKNMISRWHNFAGSGVAWFGDKELDDGEFNAWFELEIKNNTKIKICCHFQQLIWQYC